jgi:hypothetical protein
MIDNLAALDVELSPAQLRRLDETSAIDLGFPHTFLVDEEVLELIHGRTYPLIQISGG